jgi:hypothetical protein
MVGNFPQAVTHVALVIAGLCLRHATGESEQPRPQMRHQKAAVRKRRTKTA